MRLLLDECTDTAPLREIVTEAIDTATTPAQALSIMVTAPVHDAVTWYSASLCR
jgi:hypothetical protein